MTEKKFELGNILEKKFIFAGLTNDKLIPLHNGILSSLANNLNVAFV